MNGEDSELFRDEMGDVEPLRTSGRVLNQSRHQDTPGHQERRRAAQSQNEAEREGLSLDYIEPVEPLAILSFQRPGVQHGVFRKLRLGQYQLEARLDLHRMSLAQAHDALRGFIADCLKHDVRCTLLTHGKGEGRAQPAVLKSAIATWLPQLSEVLAFHSAQPHHGGAGATYVLIRKSAKKKQEAWERHIGRRG